MILKVSFTTTTMTEENKFNVQYIGVDKHIDRSD